VSDQARPREARWYPRGAWLGWRPLSSPLAPEFDDPAEVDAIVERVRRCGRVAAGDLVPAASGDSWRAFCSDHGTLEFFADVDWTASGVRLDKPPPVRPVSTRAQREQEQWEAAQRERRRAKQAEADALWHAEEQRRQAPEPIPPALQRRSDLEPWFNPARVPTPDDAHEIALYARNYLTAVLRPVRDGLLWLGSQQTAIVCERNADAIAGALMQFSRGLPPEGVVMSTETDLMPAGVLGAEATSRALAVRVLLGDEGRKVEIGLTWDLMR
jgi:hypothetical protein